MSDSIGNVIVPYFPPSGTYPCVPEFGLSKVHAPLIATHTFVAADQKREQHFYLGPNYRKWTLTHELSPTDQTTLKSFWEGHQGTLIPFTFNEPQEDGTTIAVTVQFADEPLVINEQVGIVAIVTVNLCEVYVGSGPTYTSSATDTRFPGTALSTQLQLPVQTIIPLVHIVPRLSGYPNNIYLSDRRCTIDGQLYLPRLLWSKCSGIGQTGIGLPNVSTDADQVTLVFGNADRVMRMLAADVQLDLANVYIDLFIVTGSGTGIRLQLWAGQIVSGGWQSNTGPEFTITCSDPIASPFMIAPPRVIDHLCNKLFDDAIECPFNTNCFQHTAGQLDLTHFPSATLTDCDHGYNTPNGCQAHTMQFYFNGIVVSPQAVRVKDNTTGLFGFDRSTFTSVSLISDSAYGAAVPIVVTDIDFPVNCTIIAGRDEGDFYEAAGIVCAGPVSFSPNEPGLLGVGYGTQVDGQFNSNYPNQGGLRLIVGNDPAGLGDMVSLDQAGNQTGVWPVVDTIPGSGQPAYMVVWDTTGSVTGDTAGVPQELIYWGNFLGIGGSTFDGNFSAGTAFAVCRIQKPSGETLTNLTQHTMQTYVAQGWQAPIWSNSIPEPIYAIGTITNPVHFMIDLYLLCQKLINATEAEQSAMIDLAGSFTAMTVCSEQVPRVVETSEGMETQWVCIGSLSNQRALRDWLNDIAINFLGYYYFKYGLLSIGARYNATPVDSYTDGNIIWRSVETSAMGPQFTKLVANFADREYGFVPNSASYQDDDYAAELGGGVRPNHIVANMNLAFTADISPASRFVATRAREEIGGVTHAERVAARNVKWSSTILALSSAPGMVVSVADQEIPGGTGTFRVTKWQLKPDYSVDLYGRTVTASMYDLTTGPPVTAVQPSPIPPLAFPYPLSPVWMPDFEPPITGDVVFSATDLSFQLMEVYGTTNDGSPQVQLQITGDLPVGSTELNTQSPVVRSCVTNPTGGSLLGGQTYFAAVSMLSTSGGSSPLSNVLQIFVPSGTNTNEIVLSSISWPAPPSEGWATRKTFIGVGSAQVLTMYTDTDTDQPASITVSGPLNTNSYGPPSPAYQFIRPKVKLGRHFGPIGEQISAVGSGYVTIDALAGLTDNWVGRTVSVVACPSTGTCPRSDYTVTSQDLTAGKLFLTPNPLTTGVLPFDVLVIRHRADTITATTIGDSQIVNGVYPAGNIPNAEIGSMIYFLGGTGAHQTPRTVIGNTAAVYMLDAPFEVTPDATTLWIVVTGSWAYTSDTPCGDCGTFGTPTTASVVVENFANMPVLVGGFLVDIDGNESAETQTPMRDMYVSGSQGTIEVTADYNQLPTDLVILVDATAGPVTVTMLAFSAIPNQSLFVQKVDSSANTVTVAVNATPGTDVINGNSSAVLVNQWDDVFIKVAG